MAIDYIIASVLILSAIINALALGAFWVTPGLRTTANRFVINLLIVNLVGCAVLIPSLFFCGQTTDKFSTNLSSTKSIIEKIITENVTIENRVKCVNVTTDGKNCSGWIVEKEKNIFIEEIDERVENDSSHQRTINSIEKTRCWGFDLATALGSLSVLLVVGDTWCAVTDPLRYHARVSELKAWILIAAAWFLSILFGIASAFRNEIHANVSNNVGAIMTNLSETSAHRTINNNNNNHQFNDNLFNMMFSCTYFVVIILVPIGLVCGMYWKIFKEARQNGLRMRQNGSSPLLQSALNLAAASAVVQNCASPNHVISNSGLTMKIDKNIHTGGKETFKSTTPPTNTRRYLDIPKPNSKDKNQNVVMPNIEHPVSDQQMRRNCSARHLMLVEQQTETVNSNAGIRHIHSTPNLHKSHDPQSNHNIPLLPTVQIPPKALGYMTSIRHRLSNASSIFKYREESRAARISILVVIMFLISYFPYGILILLQERVIFIENSSLLAIGFVIIANLSSPFIFAYRNKRVRRGVCRLFGIDAKTNERLQKHRIALRRSKTAATVQRSVSKVSTFSLGRSKLLIKSNGGSIVINNRQPDMEYPRSHYFSDKDSLTNKFSLLKKVCSSSRKWGCARNSCTSDSYQESPTHV